MKPIVIYDGHCVLCNRAVLWLIRRDTHKKLRFISRESPLLKHLLENSKTPIPLSDSLWLYNPPHLYEYSDAVLHAVRVLPSPWRFLSYLRIIPRLLRNSLYRIVATHRYRWFGQYEVCPLLPAEWRDRFIENQQDLQNYVA